MSQKSRICWNFFLMMLGAWLSEGSLASPPLDYATQSSLPFKEAFRVFPISSEIQIAKIKPMIESAPAGLYLTVGGERGFKAASMMPQITAVYLLDVSDTIIKFNLINRELLKAPSRKEYLNLRWQASFKGWKKYKNIQLSPEDFQWWQQTVRNIQDMPYALPEYLNRYQKSPACTDKDVPDKERQVNLANILNFKAGSYLFDDQLYQRIHKLAINDKIWVSKINLANSAELKKLLKYLKDKDLKIGVLDLNNLFFETYLNQYVYFKVVQEFLPYGFQTSILLTMWNYKRYACADHQIYLAFDFNQIKRWKKDFKIQDFFRSIDTEAFDLIDGHVYRDRDPLPKFN